MCNPFPPGHVLFISIVKYHFASTKYLPLRSIITILLLINFLVFQYARQLNYWECRLSNNLKTENEKCDCEKLIKVVTGQTKPFPAPLVHNHFHVDESFYPSSSIIETRIFYSSLPTRFIARKIFIPKIISGRLDRPPQMS